MVESGRKYWKVLDVKENLSSFYLQQKKVLKRAGKWWKGVESGRKGRKVLESAWCIKYIRPHRYQEDLIYIHILIHCRRAWIFVTVFLDYISKLYQFLSAPTLKFQHMFTLPTHPTFAV